MFPTSDYNSTSVESNSNHGVNVTHLSTDIHSYFKVIAYLYPMGISTSTEDSTSIKSITADGGKLSDFLMRY